MKVGFAELGKKFILSKYPRKIWADITIQKNILENLVRTENPKISSKDLVRTENLKDILKRFGADRKSKRYPQKIWVWTKDPKVIIERYWGGQRIQNLS